MINDLDSYPQLSKASLKLNIDYWEGVYDYHINKAQDALLKSSEAQSDYNFYYGEEDER